jgi:DNA/RNA endonuclease G (NUC1)
MIHDELTNYNLVKDQVLNALIAEGYLDAKQGKYFKENYGVLVSKKSWFASIFSKSKRNETGLYIDVIKFIDVNAKDEDELDSDNIDQLRFELVKAEKEENYELAKKLKKRIEILENKK